MLCKQLRLNWFRYTSVLNVPGNRSFGDTELAYFLLNMEEPTRNRSNTVSKCRAFSTTAEKQYPSKLDFRKTRFDVRVTSFASILFWEIGGAF